MGTLKDRRAWRRFEEALATSGEAIVMAPSSIADRLRELRGQPVHVAASRDFESQFGSDWRGASEMADSVNHALAYDRDKALDEILTLLSTWTGTKAELLQAGAAILERFASSEGDYGERVLAATLAAFVDIVEGG